MTDLSAVAWVVLVGGALGGSIVGGVAGFGAGLALMPILILVIGARAAIPVLTVTMLVGNLSRVWWSRHDVNRLVVTCFLIGAVPASALGAVLYAGAAGDWVGRVVGIFLLAALPLRRLLNASGLRVRLRHFPLVGAGIGALSSVVVTTGPVATPFFLAHGLRKTSYIGTEAVCAMAMHFTRGAVFTRYSVLSWDAFTLGCVLGATMFLGSWIGRRLMDTMSERVFLWIVEGMLVVSGLQSLFFPR